MQDHDRSLLTLLVVGAAIGLGKLLVSDDQITTRLIIGRSLLGSAASLMAGVVVLQVPDISPLALIGIASGLGIVGAQYLEAFLKRRAEKITRKITGD